MIQKIKGQGSISQFKEQLQLAESKAIQLASEKSGLAEKLQALKD